MSERVRVGPADDIGPGDRRIVTTETGLSIGVFNLRGEYHALLNRCVHQNGPLCEGQLEPDIAGEFAGIGERVDQRFTEDTVVQCPWHGWEYYVETGENAGDRDIAVPTFETVVEGGDVFVEL